MSVPTITGVQLAGDPSLPLLVCGPSLGTSASALWADTAALLGDRFHVIGWDLPGHGRNSHVPDDPFTVAELAQGVLALVEEVRSERGDDGPIAYAGDSIGGEVGLQLLLDAPDRVRAAASLCSGARLGEPEMWRERARLVREAGTPAVVELSAKRWFPDGFVEQQPGIATALLRSLQDADRFGYAATCEALAGFDVRDRLGEIAAPVLAIAGDQDVAAPVEGMRLVAEGVADGTLVVLPGVAHLAPAERPAEVAGLLADHFSPAAQETSERYAAGMQVRRAVLGDDHVDRANAAVTDLTREFQELITEYAWGGIWTRPGLDRRTRSVITLTALIARGHHEELAMHLRGARRNGLSDDEIKEVILQSAIYCGVPDANTAFRIAQQVLVEDHTQHDPSEGA